MTRSLQGNRLWGRGPTAAAATTSAALPGGSRGLRWKSGHTRLPYLSTATTVYVPAPRVLARIPVKVVPQIHHVKGYVPLAEPRHI